VLNWRPVKKAHTTTRLPWRSVAAAALALSLLGASCASGSTGSKSGAPKGVPLPATMLAQAVLDAPLAGATVKVYRSSGSLISAAGAYDQKTGADGFFVLHPKRLPKDFTIVASDGTVGGAIFSGDVKAVVSGLDGATDVNVNPVTSVIAAYHDRRPRQSLTQVSDRVKRYLGIGALVDVGTMLAEGSQIFSAKVFLDAAKEAGGFDAFVKTLAADVDAGKPSRSFAGPPTNSAGVAEVLKFVFEVVKAGAKFGYCVGTTSTTVAGKDFVLGCAMKAIGAGDSGGTDPAVLERLDEIHKQLEVVTTQLTNLQNQLSSIGNAVLQNQWNSMAATLRTGIYAEIDYAFGRMLSATNPNFSAATRQQAARDAQATMENLSLKGADSSMAHLLIGEGGSTGAIRQFSDLVRAQSGRFFVNPNAVARPGVRADTIQTVWDYMDAYQAKLEYLLIERDNAKGYDKAFIDQHDVFPYLGSPPFVPDTDPPQPVPLSQRTGNCPTAPVTAANCAGWRDQELRLVPRPLPDNAVIDLTTGRMWYQKLIPPYHYDVPIPAACASTQPGTKCPPTLYVKQLNVGYSGPAYPNLGFTNWETPDKGTLEGLTQGAPPGTRVGDWLSAAAGFYATNGRGTPGPIAPPPNVTGETRAWTSTREQTVFCPSDECPYPKVSNFVVDLLTGTTGTELIPPVYNKLLWSIADRLVDPCEHYYDNVSQPAPTC
jgi:hypothetical protein